MHLDRPLDDPLIGLASTRQLLMELKERGEMESAFMAEGVRLAIAARSLLDWLPTEMLDFRDYEREATPAIPPYVEGISMGSHANADTYDRNAA